jgi:hypothetical protein
VVFFIPSTVSRRAGKTIDPADRNGPIGLSARPAATLTLDRREADTIERSEVRKRSRRDPPRQPPFRPALQRWAGVVAEHGAADEGERGVAVAEQPIVEGAQVEGLAQLGAPVAGSPALEQEVETAERAAVAGRGGVQPESGSIPRLPRRKAESSGTYRCDFLKPREAGTSICTSTTRRERW